MESMKDFFKHLLNMVDSFGSLKKAQYYGDDFASIEVEKDGNIYVFSMRCEGKADGDN